MMRTVLTPHEAFTFVVADVFSDAAGELRAFEDQSHPCTWLLKATPTAAARPTSPSTSTSPTCTPLPRETSCSSAAAGGDGCQKRDTFAVLLRMFVDRPKSAQLDRSPLDNP
jgi:hypothetical protein